MIPHEVTAIPMFLSDAGILGWINTHFPLILLADLRLPGACSAVFVMRQFFITVPKELEEAAMIHGCSYFRMLQANYAPDCKPGLATLTIFTFVTNWNEFFDPLIFINDPHVDDVAAWVILIYR